MPRPARSSWTSSRPAGAFPMTNEQLADVFAELALLSDVLGESPFKVRAYERAAETLRGMSETAAELAESGRLREVPGFGKAIVEKIGELLRTGGLAKLDELRAKVPQGVVDMLAVPGLGPRTAGLFHEKLGVSSLDELAEALEDGTAAQLPRMGPKKIESLRVGLSQVRSYAGLFRFSEAVLAGEELSEALGGAVDELVVTGEARRGVEAVRELHLLARAGDPEEAARVFAGLPSVDGATVEGASVRAFAVGMPTRMEAVSPAGFALRLWETTGSAAHVEAVRRSAGGRIPEGAASEEDIYAAAGLPFVPPELREGRGEVEDAAAGRLPELVALSSIRGDLHVHTDWSDGRDGLVVLAAEAARLGYEYIALTDHSESLRVAHGVESDRKRRQMAAVGEAAAALPCRVLVGAEVDILEDGSLDYDDGLLAELDVVVASVHTKFTLSREAMTERICRAMENPHVDVIAHPTGRILLERAAYTVDEGALIAAAARTGTVLELNALERFDLSAENCRRAVAAGVKLAVASDAHAASHLGAMRFGVVQARRAGARRGDVLNARPLDELLSYLSLPKAERVSGC